MSYSLRLTYLDRHIPPIVVKADGLAQGKGVVVATTREEARQAVVSMLEQLPSVKPGASVVIEEFLDGEEATIMAFTDGRPSCRWSPLRITSESGMAIPARIPAAWALMRLPPDHARLIQAVMKDVFRPAVEGLSRMGSPYQGVLYAGLMIVRGKPLS